MNVPALREQHVYRPSKMLDPERFQYLWRLTETIAASSLVPESLRTKGPKNNKTDLPPETVKANVFLVVEQADRWNISPFALIQAASIVHGKLCFEGKVIAGVLEDTFGIRLRFEWNGKPGEDLGCKIYGRRPGEEQDCVWPPKDSGKEWVTVREWKTTGDGSPWRPENYARQMIYRGSREWARLYQSSLTLGVFSDDEIVEIGHEIRAAGATDVSPLKARFRDQPGFNADQVARALPDQRSVPMEIIQDQPDPVTQVSHHEEAKPAGEPAEAGEKPANPSTPDAADSKPATADSNSPSEPADHGSTDAQDGSPAPGGNSQGQGPSYDYGSYHRALARANQAKSLKTFSDSFRSSNAWTTEDGAQETLRKIYGLHQQRLGEKIAAGDFMTELKKLGVA